MSSHGDGRERPEQNVPSSRGDRSPLRSETGAWAVPPRPEEPTARPDVARSDVPPATAPYPDAVRPDAPRSDGPRPDGPPSDGPRPDGASSEGSGAFAESRSPSSGGGSRNSGGYRTRRLRRRRRIRRLVPVAVVAVMAVPIAGYGLYSQVEGNIRHVSAEDLGPRPAKRTQAENVLVVGSDSRQGANAAYGKDEGARTDTMILFHIPADGRNVRGISLPRDSMVRIPACRTSGGATVAARTGMINSAFNEAGLACAWKTVEGATGVRLDHVVQIDFTGFKSMVDALGGVELNVPEKIDDAKAGLHLAAGRQKLNGEQALGYARVRYSLGDGSDLGRIKRQQQLMTAMAGKARGQLTNPARLYSFLRAASKSVVTDKGLGLKEMFDLSSSVGDTGSIRFGTVPVGPYPADKNRLQWTQPAAGQLFDSLR
ncbi:LCP family protein [Actinomadura harenae]|uniref:LytR family transcriptional regulator n=1 Tax=Actinomadura harenae TaxID=2483351 RepID=A0A3M2MDV7_9ACTN|nr:LCP family protein [Actinomadura harenae]RMI47747.1 LytR family transcriptional regulator [Actinomadura harenae]